MSDLGLVILDSPDDEPALLRRVFDEVLRPSFAPAELPGWESFVGEVGGEGGEVVLVALDGDEPIGAAVTTPCGPAEVTLLCYLAARPGARDRGIGSFLMGHLLDRWRHGGAALVVAEVHDPRCHARTDDERPADRLRFYDRTDATVLGPWVQPALTSDGDRVRGMLLLDLFRSEPAVPAHLLGEFTETYFVFAEGAEPVDAEYAELRRRLAAATPGPGVAIDDLDLVPLLDVDPGR